MLIDIQNDYFPGGAMTLEGSAAAGLGFCCRLAHDACAARALSFNGVEVPAARVHAAFLAALQGLYAEVATVEGLVA